MLRDALAALEAGADAVIRALSFAHVEHLAADDLPVMGHLGFIPKKATRFGGIRTIGKTAAEAAALRADFGRLEDAGAFAAECELIPDQIRSERVRASSE